MSEEVAVPRNWIFSTNSFAKSYSDPRGEGVSIYSPIGQSTYTTKSRNLTPIKITCNSNSVSFILQKLILSMDVSAYDNAGNLITPGTGVKNTYLGLESIIQSLTIKAGGETVVNIPNYPLYLVQTYRNLSAGSKKLLSQLSGYGNTNIFATSSTISINHHPFVGFFHLTNDQFFPVWALPNQALEIIITLADPSTVFTSAGVGEIRVSNIRTLISYVTPPPSSVINSTRAISDGKPIFYDYVRSTQTENACSGGNRNTFLLHMSGVRSLQGIEMSFVDDDVLNDQTKDKALMYSSQGLREWRIQLGANLTIPSGTQGFSHSPSDNQTLLVTQLSNNNFDQLGEMDMSFADYDSKAFSFGWSFASKDEGSQAALSFTGTDGLLRVHMQHAVAPTQKVRMVTCYHENVTLSIGVVVTVV
ncbi:uncharacterized protein SPPG_02195 [Spizellomyces punctatus DAOM BR117]|uniref:Uncharacterized protein n=1 Tax=Spizellomyces punctatus (strain DAOM BR117) TaxID=645134 RepID=A0A0L0HQP9_SPIPD|nr:uncharacterized protein SPPG_02195 [Spizellomyces punctatus DAOM BR117]KND03134.1 hypothetical protein SPPG_02195 [Spizellomyces punctatus DAOM BR117]|eukprot:XP_016611173.1 hypothetical protein SPPG_02195 [Spizellomyces punctatus DAOM BR117]